MAALALETGLREFCPQVGILSEEQQRELAWGHTGQAPSPGVVVLYKASISNKLYPRISWDTKAVACRCPRSLSVS